MSCGGSRLHAQDHRLGARHIVDGDKEIGDVLHAAAVAEFAEVVKTAGESREHRAQFLDLGRTARGIDHEVFYLGLRAGAAHRTIEQDVTGLAQRCFGAGFIFERERGRLDHTRARRPAFTMASTIEASARGWERLKMMVRAWRATSPASAGISAPARASARRRATSMHNRITRQPAAMRFCAIGAAHDAEADDTNRFATTFLFRRHADPCHPSSLGRDARASSAGAQAAFSPRIDRLSSRARTEASGESLMRIGVAGIGKMGAAVAGRLIEPATRSRCGISHAGEGQGRRRRCRCR